VALPASGEEVAAIVKILDGTPSYGTGATLQQFEQLAADYRILHLSTHGKADDRVGDYAYLAFGVTDETGTFDRLYARDLYNYTLNADMVVLSACETGIGKLQRGEGIISLARAFAYAGAKSIFTTLWQVSDEKTKYLMVYFYKNLKQGQTKDAALRNAKLEYMDKNNSEALHPFFWAGLIGIGDMSRLSAKE
jgi:CHAT domain-containing protein